MQAVLAGVTKVAEAAEPNSSDEETVAQLHHQLGGRLRSLAFAMLQDWSLADDAVQDAFLLLVAKSAEIPATQRQGWLVRTVQYSALNLRRTRQRQLRLAKGQWERATRELGSEVDRDGISRTGSSYDESDRRVPPQMRMPAEVKMPAEVTEQFEQLRQAVSELPAAQRLVVQMRLVEDKTFQAIADELNLPLGTVLSRMRLAVEKLRSKLT